jgi:glutathione S-transferase
MLIVHHLNNSRSQRILWLLEELGVPYEVKRYERDPKTMLAPPELRRRYIYWLHFAEGSAMPPLVMSLVFNEIPKQTPFFVRPVANAITAAVQKMFLRPNIEAQLDFIEAELTANAWLAGEAFSAADVMMSFPLEAASARGGFGARPRIKDWLARIHARPAYQAALQKGGPYAYSSADT